MKKIYLAVLIFLASCLFLFAFSFIYLDKVNHKTFHYVIRTAEKDTGTIRVDRFFTEDKIIYKSITRVPFEPVYTEYRARLVLDKGYNIESYTKERVAGRSTDIIYLENFKNLVSFVSRYQSKFACTENIPIKRGTFVFEEESPVTYLPIIENYDFSRGRSQGFSAISCLQSWSLPPMKRFITFTSINNERIKIDSRKIEAENLILKIRDFPQCALWAGRSDRSLMKLDLPHKNQTIVRTFRPKTLKAAERRIVPEGYGSKDVAIKAKAVELFGTLTFPSKEGRFPAVLFVSGAGPHDRDYQGLFAGIADYLSKNGFVCLRYDKRGIGSSGGDAASSTDLNEMEDLESVLHYMANQDIVDPGKIILIGHARGAIHAMNAASKNKHIKGLVMMAPPKYQDPDEEARKEELRRMGKKLKWKDEYVDLVLRSSRETQSKTAGSNGDWVYVLGKKCFLGGMKGDIENSPSDAEPDPGLPILTLKGKDADDISGDSAAIRDKAASDIGNNNSALTYYAYLGQYFGHKITDGSHRHYYDTDKEVLENIKSWLNTILSTGA